MFLRLLIFCLLFSIASSVLSADIRIAILGDLDKNRAEIDVLTEKLSKEAGVALVERSDIEKVLREQEIAAGSVSGEANPVKLGRLLGAQGVIIIKAFDYKDKSVLSARLVSVESGAIINVWADDPDKHADSMSWGSSVAKMFTPSLGKVTVSKTDAIPVSILNIRSSWNNEAGLRFASKLRLLLELRMMMQKEVFILERWKLGALKWEKELQETTEKFWTGAYIVEGRIEKYSEEKDLVEISIFLSRPGQENPDVIRKSGKLSDPLGLVNNLSDEMLKIMGQRQSKDEKLENWKVELESNAYANEAFWAYRAGQYEASRAAADAAMALGNDNPNLKFVNIKSHLAEFAECSTFSFNVNDDFTVKTNTVIHNELLTKEKISILINGIQACKEFALDAPGNASKLWGAYNDWRILCAEAISCAGNVLRSIERDNKFDKEAAVLRRLCRDFAHCVAAKGGDSDLIFPFLSLYIDELPSFSEDPDMMLEEYRWLLSLDFPALSNVRLKIRESLITAHKVREPLPGYLSQDRKFHDWFSEAEKNKTAKDYGERIRKSREKREEWCAMMIGSPDFTDKISGFILREEPSDVPVLIDLYDKNFYRIATGGDSYDCMACIPKLIARIPGNPFMGISLGENVDFETFCGVFQCEDASKVDLTFVIKHLYWNSSKKVSAAACRRISQVWLEFKMRLMRANPESYLMDSDTVSGIDRQLERIRRETSGDASTSPDDKRNTELVLKEKIELPSRPEYFDIPPSQWSSVYFKLAKMSYVDGKLLVLGTLERQSRKLQITYSINPKTRELSEFRPPSKISGRDVGDDGMFFSSKENLYYVDENGIVLKNAWGGEWKLVADAGLKNPTAGCHVGGSLFIAFGKGTGNTMRSTDAGWRSDIIEIPDGSSDIKIFASNTRRPPIVEYDDCRPYETMIMFGSPDGATLFFGTYMRPCYKLLYCDLKNPSEWKTSLHHHVGSESKMYGNPYDGGVFFSCSCGHYGCDLNFATKGYESKEVFLISRDTLVSSGKTNANVKWSVDDSGAPSIHSTSTERRNAFNGRNLVYYSSRSDDSYMLCFRDDASGAFRIALRIDETSGKDKVPGLVSIASSDEFIFVYDSSNSRGSRNPYVWFIRWKEMLEKMEQTPSVPEIKITPSIFVDSARVTMSAEEGEKILYSIDAAFDMKTAKVYSDPFEMKESGRITACSVKSNVNGGVPSLPKIRDCLKMPLHDSVDLKNPVPGLRYACWKGAWERIPIFDKIKPFKTGVLEKIDLDASGIKEYSASRYSSFLKVPVDGLYHFNIEASGQAIMKVHGIEVHPTPPKGTATKAEFQVGLKAGYHPVEIYFIKEEGKSELKIQWESAGLPRSVLPEDIFFIDGEMKNP